MNHARYRFQRRAVLVRKADDHRFSGTRHKPQRQGPHVCGDDMLYLRIDMKPHCRIFAGNVRVCKAVEYALVHMVVPVLQVEIMEQCPEDQIFIIYTDMQTNSNGTADPHYRKAVL